jgi:hypothetical protein
MKEKLEMLIEENLIDLAKRRADEEQRPLSDLVEDALMAYLSGKIQRLRKRERAYRIFCGQPIQISGDQFEEILKEDN